MNSKVYTSQIKIPLSTLGIIVKPTLIVIAMLYAVMTFYNHWMFPFTILVIGMFIWLQFFCGKDSYEYKVSADSVVIDRIKRNGTVKNVKTFNAPQILMLAQSRSENLNRFIEKGKKVLMEDYSSRKNPEKEYVLVCKEEEKISMIMLELETDMLDAFKECYPDIVKLNKTPKIDIIKI
ncbi:MAG: hypothetical protein RR846_05815 [Oscillospiraceae bacterium]